MDHTYLKMLVLLYENKLFEIRQHMNYRNPKQECSEFYNFSCSCIPLYPEELSSADLMRHMHK